MFKGRRFLLSMLVGAALFGISSFATQPSYGQRANDLTFSHKMPPETNQLPTNPDRDSLLADFQNPVDKVRTGAYWYWLSGNSSREGARKDLIAMKSVGIDRAYIGDIGQEAVPTGPVRFFSDDWWEIIHTAFKTASEIGVEMGIFNSPGWSQSGGPWISYKEAMRYVVVSEKALKGPMEFKGELDLPPVNAEKPHEYQDVKVLAYPAPEGSNDILKFDFADGFALPAGEAKTIVFENKGVKSMASVTVTPSATPLVAQAELYAVDGDTKTKLVAFEISRYNPEKSVGFIPYAPVTANFAPTAAKTFELVVKSDRAAALASVEISGASKVAAVFDKTLAKMHQTPQPYWSEYQWPAAPEAYRADDSLGYDPSQVVDLTDKFQDGVLTWTVPEGDWIVARFGAVPTGTTNAPAVPEATGYEVDKMSREHAITHFNAYMKDLIERFPEEDMKSFTTVVQDSYEVGGQNFTDNFAEKFEASFGYDPTPYLPVFYGSVAGNLDISERFLWDLRRFIADEVAYSYVGGLRDASNEHGRHTWLECYGHWGFPGEWLQYGGQSNEIAGEYWSEGELGNVENRIAASCGHIYGKTKIWSESNTCAGNPYGRSPVNMKKRTDRFFSEGINNTLLHLYVQQPDERKPGFNAWFGNEFNRHNTWFTQLDLYVMYLKRANYMLQQGLNVADVAYFIGEDCPKMMGVCDPPLPSGYQFDFINGEVLRETTSVDDNGLLTLPHGTQYKLLVLPKLETMRPELLKRVKELVEDGAFVLGPKPNRSPSLQNYPQADKEVQALADALWGDVDGVNVKFRKVGKGTIASGLTMEEALAMVNCAPDCEYPEETGLVYCRRAMKDSDVYFIANQHDKELVDVDVTFRVDGKQPEIWFPATGETRDVQAWSAKDGRTTIPLSFAAQESYFVVFEEDTDATKGSASSNAVKLETLVAFDGAWDVSFDSGEIARGPKDVVKFDSLIDWTTSEDDAIKFYSGTAVYKTTFRLNGVPKCKVFLSFGDVCEMAKAKINGKEVGGVWTAPYRLDVTSFLEDGKNTLEIEVVNCWVNRLIGDAGLPEAERKTWCPVNTYTPQSPLKKSGLIGPVVLATER
ncbi:MAG: glycosyl hydrolase [Thermoguttaceae bacterium]|nr:glycosyl hydrolase [Thermoguttaceae bacterium]